MQINKWEKRCIAFLSDTTVALFSWLSASWLTNHMLSMTTDIFPFILHVVFLQCIAFMLCGLYRGVWHFASVPDLLRIAKAVLLGTLTSFALAWYSNNQLPLRIFIVYGLLSLVLLSASRLLFRLLRDYRTRVTHGKRVLIVGAGNAGEGIVRDLSRSLSIYKYLPVAIVDDDTSRHGCDVHGVRVLGSCQDIPALVTKHGIELILIAIPSANSKRMREIVQYCEESGIPFRTLPSLKDIADGNIATSALREVLIEDLLGREQVDLDWQAISNVIQDKIVLVTGGGGSIGSELCRQIAALSPRKLIILDNNEFNLYAIDLELSKKIQSNTLTSVLCSVTDKPGIERIFATHRPEIVFHVAAYKHVPLLERHVRIAMYNNIIGTKIIAETAEHYQVKSFVLISTDKAVNPSSLMGATKRASEIFCQTYNKYSATRFSTVRFGNVLESAGSVIPLFRAQLRAGGPLTVTHRDMSRYFMTIPEASQLILQATAMDQDGHIFVLDMGDPINIRYLAEQLIKLSGKVVGQDIDIVYTGLRPGEKLHEELFHENENICETAHTKIRQAKVREYDWAWLSELMENIEIAYHAHDDATLHSILCKLVPEYQSKKDIKDTIPTNGDKIYSDYLWSTV